jgi:hypothetical protein
VSQERQEIQKPKNKEEFLKKIKESPEYSSLGNLNIF